MRQLGLFCSLLLVTACGGTSTGGNTAAKAGVAAPDFQVKGSARRLKGPEGFRVDIVDVEGADFDALVMYSGTFSELDGVPMPSKRVKAHVIGRAAYETTLHGETFWMMWESGRRSIESWASLPEERRQPIRIYWSETGSADVKPGEVASKFRAQYGKVLALQAWDGDARKARYEKDFASEVAAASEVCGATFEARIDWSEVDRDMLSTWSIGGLCEPMADAMADLCKKNPSLGKDLTTLPVRTLECHAGGKEQNAATFQDGVLRWTPARSNAGRVSKPVLAATLGYDRLVLRGPENLHIAFTPWDGTRKMHYGDGKKFFEHRTDGVNGHRAMFGGDVHSDLDQDDKGNWFLRCGTKQTPMEIVPQTEANAMLKAATYAPAKFQRKPFALARDDRGNYYYVDKLIDEAGGKDFRVHTGRKGRVRSTRLKDIVDDEKGLIFATKTGDLRLIIDRGMPSIATWLRGKKKGVPLSVVHVAASHKLIFSELGVYAEQDLGTACGAL